MGDLSLVAVRLVAGSAVEEVVASGTVRPGQLGTNPDVMVTLEGVVSGGAGRVGGTAVPSIVIRGRTVEVAADE
eukprot:contig_37961_g8907